MTVLLGGQGSLDLLDESLDELVPIEVVTLFAYKFIQGFKALLTSLGM